MYKDIRENLNKVTGELIESFVDFDKERVIKFQAGLHAIRQAQQEKGLSTTNLYGVRDDENLEQLLQEHNVSIEDYQKVPEIIKGLGEGCDKAKAQLDAISPSLKHAIDAISAKEAQVYDVPIAGMIAVTLNLVSPEVKNALIAGQAGERALKATERASSILSSATQVNKESVLKDVLYDYVDQSKPARMHIDDSAINNPQYLVAAKATNHLADLMESGIKLAPKVIEESSVQNALEHLKSLSINIFNESSKRLKEAGTEDAAEKIGNLARYLAEEYKKDNIETVEDALNAAKEGLDRIRTELVEKDIFTPKEIQDFDNLVQRRISQIRGAKAEFITDDEIKSPA